MATETKSTIVADVDTTIELSPLDHFVTTFACIPWTAFYSYDISGDQLKEALEKIAVSYPVLCGRLKKKEEARVEIVVMKGVGFSFLEGRRDMSLKEAVAQAHVKEQSAGFPSFAELPFMAAQMQTMATVDQDAPLFIVKLTHFNDGTCSLAATVHHTIADAQRLAELMVDMSVAYRGEELRTVDHDRSQAWPDKLLEKVPIGMDGTDFPHKVTTEYDVLPYPSFPEETYSVESFYFPVSVIDELKSKITAALNEGEYVSQMDVVTAVLWMMHAELAAVRDGTKEEVKTAGDLGIHQTFFLYFVDLVGNDSPLITENFFGNAYFGTVIPFPEAASEEAKSANIMETAIQVANVVRKHVLMVRPPPAQLMACIAVYKALTELPPYPPILGGVSSFYKMPWNRMDYGKGTPVFNYGLPAYPFADVWGSICPTADGKGILVQKIIRTCDKQRVLNSTVLHELVPGYAILSQKEPTELAKLLGL